LAGFFPVLLGDGRDDARLLAGRVLPLGVLAPAVLRPVFRRAAAVRRGPAPLRAAARAPEPARLFDGVFFWPFVEPFLEEPAAFRFAAFLAIVC
jgi:hypothetical protein